MSGPLRIRLLRLPHGEGIEPPAYMTAGAAGADVRAAIEAPLTVEPGATVLVPTGFAFEIPDDWEVQLRPRSGLAVKHGLTIVNAPATIDSDYRGEVKVALVHLGREPFTLERGMRIAQAVASRVTRIAWDEVDALAASERGTGGFGHSGM
jgi:dUTP pyrophosphatase